MSGWVDLKNLFVSCLITTLPDFLTYSLLFRWMSGWVDLKNIFVVSRLSTTLPDFLTYLLLFRRMAGWVHLNNLVSYLAHSPRYRISLLTYYFFQGCQAQFTSKNVLFLSGLVDFRSGFWHWIWLLEGVIHSSISQQICFRFSLSWLQNRVLTPIMVTPSGHPVEY